MNAFGLTGNIGCGKSTVARLLAQYYDVSVVDCDLVAKDIIKSGLYKDQINQLLGVDVFPGGKVDFGTIAKVIFGNTAKKDSFEKLIHPMVWSVVEEKVAVSENNKILIVESALIYEIGSAGRFDAVIVVACGQEEQLRRLRENRKMNEVDLQARLSKQIPSAEKERQAQFVIRTDCSMEELTQRVNALYEDLKQQKTERLSK